MWTAAGRPLSKIDRGKKEITIRYDNGKIEKLKLTDRAAADVGKNIGPDTRIVVYDADEAGGKVTHYFKKRDTPLTSASRRD